MKNLLKSIAVVFAFGVSFSACTTDPCKDVNCGTTGVCNTVGTCDCDPCYSGTSCETLKDCGAHGTCAADSCACETGYELDGDGKCETLIRTKFISQWAAAENCGSTSNYNVTILGPSTTNLLELTIGNFWGLFQNNVIATVSANGTITIAEQEPDNDDYFVSGTGTYVSGTPATINMTYTILKKDAAGAILQTTNCTATFTDI